MKYLKQFGIILFITLIGEVLNAVLPLPIPASIYGLVLMFIALQTKVISLGSVEDVAVFMIEIMPIMFIPPAIGLMESWGIIKPICVPLVVITVASTVIVMVSTGWVTQLISRGANKNSKEKVVR